VVEPVRILPDANDGNMRERNVSLMLRRLGENTRLLRGDTVTHTEREIQIHTISSRPLLHSSPLDGIGLLLSHCNLQISMYNSIREFSSDMVMYAMIESESNRKSSLCSTAASLSGPGATITAILALRIPAASGNGGHFVFLEIDRCENHNRRCGCDTAVRRCQATQWH
jgi:hypothetical protein